MFMMKWLLLLMMVICLLFVPCRSCGTGSGTSGNNDQDTVNNLLQIFRYLPPDFNSLRDSLILRFLNEQLAKTFEGNFRAEGYNSISKGVIACPSDLACHDFQNCRWHNTEKDKSLSYYKGRGEADPDKWQFIMGTRELPDEPYALLASNVGDYNGHFVSDPIPYQEGNAVVEFRYWMSPFVTLKVCVDSGGEFIYCSPLIQSFDGPGPISVTIPGPIESQFKLVFVAENFITDPGGLAAIDDIHYRSSLCNEGGAIPTSSTTTTDSSSNDGSNRGQSGSLKQGTSGGNSDPSRKSLIDACTAIPCDFESGTCNYNVFPVKADQEFVWQRGRIGNPLTGITRDRFGRTDFTSGYLLAHGKSNGYSDKIIAESVGFVATEPLQLQFYRHQASKDSSLKVCVDFTTNCIRTFNDLTRRWTKEVVPLPDRADPKKPMKVLFVTEGLSHTGYMGIDDIDLVDFAPAPRSLC